MRNAQCGGQVAYARLTLPPHPCLSMILDMEIGLAIEHFRRLAGLNQSELAARLDVDQGNLSRMLRGNQDIYVSKLESIAAALGVRGSDILAYAEDHDATAARWRSLYRNLPPDEREAALKILEPRGQYGTGTTKLA